MKWLLTGWGQEESKTFLSAYHAAKSARNGGRLSEPRNRLKEAKWEQVTLWESERAISLY